MDRNPFDDDFRDYQPAEVPDYQPEPKPEARKVGSGRVVYHNDIEQGSDEWAKLRTGLLTASEMKLVITPTLKVADNDKTRAHLWELLAQRITNYVEPTFYGDDMMRGHDDEVEARRLYRANYSPTTSCGFITNDRWGFTLGCSPDDLVGDDGMIECKSRRQKFQIQTVAENEVPAEYVIQLQTAMLVAERQWVDFISYSGGLPMFVKRVEADPDMQAAIVAAATAFEQKLADKEREYRATLAAMPKLIPTERRIELEMYQ